jgi:hypothetical protein
MSEGIIVNVDNFVRAESDRMLADLQAEAGAVNTFGHRRAPADVNHQPVIRMNRDTLYSFAVVDLAEPVTLSLPDAGSRYVSAMIVSQDHYIHDIVHGPSTHVITQERTGTRYALVAARILVDADDPDDVAAVAALQDQLRLDAGSAEPFVAPAYDAASLDATRAGLLELMKGLRSTEGMFGTPDQVDKVRHLIGTAAGWGGLPTSEAVYVNASPGLPVGRYALTVRDVPVDGFWSLSVYNAQGFFEPNDRGAYSVNSVTGVRDVDGSITVHLGDWDEDTPNAVPLPEGWNYIVRLYRPRQEIHDGTWAFPTLDAAG